MNELRQEYNRLLNFQSPFLTKVLFIHQDPDFLYIILDDELQDYNSLSSIIAKRGFFPEKEAKRIFMKVLMALNHLHSGG
mmetsp:Transcript_58666/g.127389  ORF Transcript_58666/g.127389 Transcript_58666/m.127389 type:complete len:80 (+) Transcript_58666:326-565(+)